MYTNITYGLYNWKTCCIMTFMKYKKKEILKLHTKIRKQQKMGYSLENLLIYANV